MSVVKLLQCFHARQTSFFDASLNRVPLPLVDLWSGADRGVIADSYSATLRPGETRLIRATPTVGGGPITIEAEAAGNTLAGAAAVASCAAPSRTLTITYELSGTRTFFVSVNGAAGSPVTVTGSSWSSPANTTVTVPLNAGSNSIRFFNDGAYAPDLDRISIA